MLKVFLGWSGDVSHNVALTLRDWLPKVIQAVKPYVSSEDIAKGARWASEIAKELQTTSYGIICVTKENVNSPWINFEAGALSREIEKSYVTPFLFGLRSAEVAGPLSLFQHTAYSKEDVLKLLSSINERQEPEIRLQPGALDEAFETYWPRLEAELDRIEKEQSATPLPEKRDPTAMLEELVDMTRALKRETWSLSKSDVAALKAGLDAYRRRFDDLTAILGTLAENMGVINGQLSSILTPLPSQSGTLRALGLEQETLSAQHKKQKELVRKILETRSSTTLRVSGAGAVAASGDASTSGSEDGHEKGE